MKIQSILSDKQIKGKEKTEAISQILMGGEISVQELLEVASGVKGSDKGACVEAMEFATRMNPEIATTEMLEFVSLTLSDKAPRVKWESAKVIGNIAHRFPKKLDAPIRQLLVNSEDAGTVVRWSAAFALGEIIKLNTSHNKELLPAIDSIILREEKNSIRKIYQAALKKMQ